MAIYKKTKHHARAHVWPVKFATARTMKSLSWPDDTGGRRRWATVSSMAQRGHRTGNVNFHHPKWWIWPTKKWDMFKQIWSLNIGVWTQIQDLINRNCFFYSAKWRFTRKKATLSNLSTKVVQLTNRNELQAVSAGPTSTRRSDVRLAEELPTAPSHWHWDGM